VIAFMRLVENPADEVSLLRVVGVPPRGIGDKTILALQTAAFQANKTPGEVLLDLGQKVEQSAFWPVIGRSAALLADFGSLLSDWATAKGKLSIAGLFDRILSDIGYESYINDHSDEGVDRWENVMELRRLAMDFQDRGLTEFLQNLALVSDQDTIKDNEADSHEDKGSVTLLTLHAAKGLEFKQVFIIGLDEGILPHSRSKEDPEEMAEERRLFYVGITRARDQLYLVRAERRTTFGDFEYTEPSRFLENISENLVTVQGRRGGSRRESHQDDFKWGSFSKPASSRRVSFESPSYNNKEPVYKPGMRVRNTAWGEGIVLESKVDVDGEETVDIHFESVGFKRLIASLAGLEIIK
jgi:DNA helicase II / ATP-dependent DNA helicase PcrA